MNQTLKGEALPELSVEEITDLAQSYLAGDPSVEQAQRLNTALQEDPQAALEMLTRMQDALDPAPPGGLSPADWPAVDASVETYIQDRASHSSGPWLRWKAWLRGRGGGRAKPAGESAPAAASAPRPRFRWLTRGFAALAGLALALVLALALGYALVAQGAVKRPHSLRLPRFHLFSASAGPKPTAPAPAAPVMPAPPPTPKPAAAGSGTAVRALQPMAGGPLPSELPHLTPMPSGKLDLDPQP
jgi:hypothetical protein